MRLYAATTNPGKLRDFDCAAQSLAAAGRWRISALPDVAGIPPPAEDEPTFAGNARAKALYYAREAAALRPGMLRPGLLQPDLRGALILADDSGLEVDALGGEPGVRSARYAEDHAYRLGEDLSSDERNNRLLLARLGDAGARTARYRCALAVARCATDAEVVAESEGILEGEILAAAQGQGGFGYDPLFYVAEAGKTMAEMPMEMRLQFSHRGRALRALLERWPAARERGR